MAGRSRRLLAFAVLVVVSSPGVATAQEAYGLPLQGKAAKEFLRSAVVLKKKALGSGITGSEQLTLGDGAATHKAVWKTIDAFRHGVTSFEGGATMVDYEDSYRFEIAAYELDKRLGFDLVPPTVERVIDHKTGAVQLWVEGASSEWDRRKKGLAPPDAEAWNRQIHRVRLFHQLTFDWDAQNTQNVLFDPSFRVYAIDFSRSFAVYAQVPSEKLLERFSRSALEAIGRLDEPGLRSAIGRWLSVPQIRTLLKRRDRILAVATQRVAEKGEAAVLYP